jgi:hypothetical protein
MDVKAGAELVRLDRDLAAGFGSSGATGEICLETSMSSTKIPRLALRPSQRLLGPCDSATPCRMDKALDMRLAKDVICAS